MKFPISRRFSRRGKLPAAAAYENHAAWRRSAAADNTVIYRPPNKLVTWRYFASRISVANYYIKLNSKMILTVIYVTLTITYYIKYSF